MDRSDIQRIKHIKRYCEDIAGAVFKALHPETA